MSEKNEKPNIGDFLVLFGFDKPKSSLIIPGKPVMPKLRVGFYGDEDDFRKFIKSVRKEKQAEINLPELIINFSLMEKEEKEKMKSDLIKNQQKAIIKEK